MAMSDHPGYLGRWASGVILLHADWPNYPAGEGPWFGLSALGRFPAGTSFTLVDDIDRCALLVAEQYGTYEDPFDSRAFHVAVWHEDLLELAEQGYLIGTRALTERQYEEQKRERMRAEMRAEMGISAPEDPLADLYVQLSDGTYKHVEFPSLATYDHHDEEIGYEAGRTWLGMLPEERIQVTESGFEKLEREWGSGLQIPRSVEARVKYLLDGGLYDSVLRDLGALAETRMKEISGSTKFGQELVSRFIEHLIGLNVYANAEIKVFRSELRTAFKFYRNEFAHNIVDLPRARGYALISQMCDIVTELDLMATRGGNNDGGDLRLES